MRRLTSSSGSSPCPSVSRLKIQNLLAPRLRDDEVADDGAGGRLAAAARLVPEQHAGLEALWPGEAERHCARAGPRAGRRLPRWAGASEERRERDRPSTDDASHVHLAGRSGSNHDSGARSSPSGPLRRQRSCGSFPACPGPPSSSSPTSSPAPTLSTPWPSTPGCARRRPDSSGARTDRGNPMPDPRPIAFEPFTEEHQAFRRTVREFCEKELAPHAREWDETGDLPARALPALRRAGLPRDPARPEHWGGSGLDYWYVVAYAEELVRSPQRRREHGPAGAGRDGHARSSARSAPTSRSGSSSPRRCAARRSPRSASPSPTPAPTSPPSAPPRAATATTTSSTARRCGSPTARAPTSSRSRCAPARSGYGGISLVTFPTDVKGFGGRAEARQGGQPLLRHGHPLLRGLPHPAPVPARRGEPGLLPHHDRTSRASGWLPR